MFDSGPQFVFNMGGGPGVRVHQFGGARPRRRPRDPNAPPEQPATAQSTLMGLLPLLIILILPLLSSIFSGSSSTPSGPSMRFDKAHPPHTMHRQTPQLKVDYYINPAEVEEYNPAKFKTLDKKAENSYVQEIRYKCEVENQSKMRLQEEAQGWFFPDMEKMAKASKMEMKACRRYEELQKMARGY
jgi:DnaJ homolog subfamily B member 12